MNDQQIEQEMQEKGLTAPRITCAHIDDIIVVDDYYVFPNSTITVCRLILKNGFSVLGDSACASPDNFDVILGRKIARDNAKQKIWELEGYLLREKLST